MRCVQRHPAPQHLALTRRRSISPREGRNPDRRRIFMINLRTVAAALAVGVVVAAAASPALAASAKRTTAHPGHAARAQAIGSEPARAKASDRESIMRECSVKYEGMKQHTWGVQQGAMYRNCMAEHGQME
jgi:hypothetical protein